MNPQNAPRKRSRSLTQEVVLSLTQQIRQGAFQAGSKLPPEAELMQREGVSRTVVREAISQLQAARLVETRHGIGTFVLDMPDPVHSDISLNCNLVTLLDVMSILEFRISIESEAAGLAAQRRTADDINAMRTALEQFDMKCDLRGESAVRSEASIEADIAFHTAIAAATGNRYFADVLKQLGAAIIPRSRVNAVHRTIQEQQEYLRQINNEHKVVLSAIERQDSDSARAAMRTHLSNSRERLRTLSEQLSEQQQTA
ncbi:MAG: FadR/GntR family transcriptional regulator [Corticimicrobacter sp.]|uniref:FadR/GntR family transcriptional regulator n=1 Tax=Corticimicrobacter sp. TaxID=2678536 RepID=UPI0032DAA476